MCDMVTPQNHGIKGGTTFKGASVVSTPLDGQETFSHTKVKEKKKT